MRACGRSGSGSRTGSGVRVGAEKDRKHPLSLSEAFFSASAALMSARMPFDALGSDRITSRGSPDEESSLSSLE